MRSIYLRSNLGHWDSVVIQDPTQEKAMWGGHFINSNSQMEHWCGLGIVLSAFLCIISFHLYNSP